MSGEDRPKASRASTTQPRIWPAVVIAATHLSVSAVVWALASTNIPYMLGFALAPVVAMALLGLWWLFASRVRWWERLGGIVLCAAVPPWIILTHEANGFLLLMVAAPALTFGVVGLLVLTQPLRWPVRRLVLVLYVVGCAGVFTAVRVDGVRGNVMPVLAWRWSPAPGVPFGEMKARAGGVADVPARAEAGDWPQFRGARQDGTRPGVTFGTDWAGNPPREVWRIRVGLGWSSFAVVQDYAFTQEQRGSYETVVCYRADSGEEVWSNGVETRFDEAMGSGPRATPTFHEGGLYTLGATGVLQRLDAATGEAVWRRDLTEATGATIPTWGFASSPLVTGDLVVVFAGGRAGQSVAAFHRSSGEVAWLSGPEGQGYGSAQMARLSGVPQILMISSAGLLSLEPENGDVRWEHSWDMGGNTRVVQPMVLADEAILIGSSFGKGTRRLDVSRSDSDWNVNEQYTSRAFRPYFNDFVLYEGHCYGFDGNRLTCIDASTGERRWSGGRTGGQVLLLPDMGTLLVLSERGDVILFAANPDECREIARIEALDGKTWNHPVVSHQRLFVRNDQYAVCFDLPPLGPRQ